MGKNHPNQEVVGISSYRETNSVSAGSDYVVIQSLLCKKKKRFEASKEGRSSNLSSLSMRVIFVVLHFNSGNDKLCFFRVCNTLTETSFKPGY